MASLQKNIAGQNVTFCLVNATTGAADATGTGLAGKFTGDNAAQASCTGTFTNKGGGQYNYAPVQAETNFTDVGFLFTATGDIPLNIDFHTDLTDAAGNFQVDVTKWLGTAVTAATAGIPDVNIKNINNIAGSGITTVNANMGTTQPLNFTGTAGSALVQSDARDINGVAATAVTTINAIIGSSQPINFTGTGGSALIQTDARDWNGTPMTGTIPPDATFIRSGTAQAGTASTITLDAGASAVNNTYNGETVFIRSGTGISQSAVITAYNGTTKVATIAGTWATNPDATSVFTVAAFGPVNASISGTVNANVIQWNAAPVGTVSPDTIFIRSGTAQAGSATSITLDAGASATNNFYNNEVVFIRSGTGAGQSNIITGYVGATKVATVGNAWATNPDATSVFSVMAFGPGTAVVSGAVTANVTQWLGSPVTAATAGIPDTNAKNINNISTASVTTINANQGTTQPLNFTGTAGSALVKSDVTDIATVAVNPAVAQIGANLVNIAGATVNPALAQIGTNTVSFSASLLDANSLLKTDVEDINGNPLAAQALSQSARSICWGTASGGTTSTVTVSSLNNPTSLTDAGQLIGRTIIFLGNTSSGHLQAQASNITSSTTGSTPTIGYTNVMTAAPAAGDLFVVV